jgi:D-serine deaminase-like pyridoxal phosphate-dependent protein
MSNQNQTIDIDAVIAALADNPEALAKLNKAAKNASRPVAQSFVFDTRDHKAKVADGKRSYTYNLVFFRDAAAEQAWVEAGSPVNTKDAQGNVNNVMAPFTARVDEETSEMLKNFGFKYAPSFSRWYGPIGCADIVAAKLRGEDS